MASQNAAYHVLLIEEDPKETELYSDLIREVDHCRVDVMSRLENSFDWISRSNYHLVVIDASVRKNGSGALSGGADGLAILEQIKRISPVTSVILISEQGTVEQAVAAIRLGAEDYLKKPFNLEGFKLAVKRGLDRKAVFGGDTGVSNVFNLLNSCQMISASLEQNKIFGIVQSYFSRELRCDHTAIYQLVPGAERAEPVRVDDNFESSGHTDRAMEEIIDISLHASNPIPGMLEHNEYTRFIDRGTLTPGLFVFRFKCAGPSQYFCVSLSPQRPPHLDEFESRLRMLRLQIEVTGKNIEQYMGVANLVYRDDATGLYNTRYLNYILDREIAQSKTTGKSFAVLFIDADKFKGINDNHGHLVGTKLLNELGEHFKRFVRERDTVFRYGGDEFVAVLSSCDLPTARVVAERIRESVEKRVFLSEEGLNLHFTVSIGVAIFPDHAKSKKEIIDAADHAMYDAKKTTRNSVAIAGLPKPDASTNQVAQNVTKFASKKR
ncbi:MAG: diguanylate cyclase [Bdellovibrionia bacterium]